MLKLLTISNLFTKVFEHEKHLIQAKTEDFISCIEWTYSREMFI